MRKYMRVFSAVGTEESLQKTHINTGLLIAEIQANLARNKTNESVPTLIPIESSNSV